MKHFARNNFATNKCIFVTLKLFLGRTTPTLKFMMFLLLMGDL